MARRFTITDLLFWVTFVALLLALTVPIWRMIQRAGNLADMVEAVAASADGSTFGALFGDGKVLLWDSSGTLKSTLQTYGTPDGRLALSHDGRYIAAAPYAEPRASYIPDGQVFDVVTSKLVKTIEFGTSSLNFSPIENLLAIGVNTIELHSLDDERAVRTIASGGNRAKFSPNGRLLAIASSQGGLEVWDAATAELLHDFDLYHRRLADVYADLAWSPDGSMVAALRVADINPRGVQTVLDDRKMLEIWDLATGKSREAATGGKEPFETLAFLPSGRTLLLASEGNQHPAVVDVATLTQTPLNDGRGFTRVAAGLRADAFITAGTSNVDLWDAATLKPRRRLFERSPTPNVIPPGIGLLAWVIWFNIRRVRKLVRPFAS
jgi:WD40 repeat protein